MRPRFLAVSLGSVLLAAQLANAQPLGNAVAYHGQLKQAGAPVEGVFDLKFAIYDAPTDGNTVGSPVVLPGFAITNGDFSTTLDFGPNVFDGSARWLEIAVRTNGASAFQILSPRQVVSPVPYALYAASSGTATLASSVSGNGAQLTNLNAAALAGGIIPDTRLSTNVITSSGTNQIDVSRIRGLAAGDLNFANVLAYGAVADGTTDSTVAFSNALASGKAVLVPPGQYLVGSLRLGDNTFLFGAGAKLKFIPGTATLLDYGTHTNITISGLLLDGGLSTVPTIDGGRPGRCGISGMGVGPVLLDHVSAMGFSGCGFYLNAITFNLDIHTNAMPILRDCIARFCYNGIAVENVGFINLENCQAVENYYGMRILAGNTRITGGQVTDNFFGVHLDAVINPFHSTITGLALNHNQVRELTLFGCIFGGEVANNSIIGGAGIMLQGCSGVDIHDNVGSGDVLCDGGGGNYFRHNVWAAPYSFTCINGDTSVEYDNVWRDGSPPAGLGIYSAFPSNYLAGTIAAAGFYGPLHGQADTALSAGSLAGPLPTLTAGLVTSSNLVLYPKDLTLNGAVRDTLADDPSQMPDLVKFLPASTAQKATLTTPRWVTQAIHRLVIESSVNLTLTNLATQSYWTPARTTTDLNTVHTLTNGINVLTWTNTWPNLNALKTATFCPVPATNPAPIYLIKWSVEYSGSPDVETGL
jgi:hypothetical protein